MDQCLQYVGGTVGAAVLTGAAISTAMYFACKSQPFTPLIDLQNQSEELKGSERVRMSKLCKNQQPLKYIYDDVRTLFDTMYSGMKMSNDGPCLGWRENRESQYQWINYSQVIERSQRFGSGLVSMGLKPGPTTFVGIFAKNAVEWVLTEQACYHFSMVIVPLYDTLGPSACSFIIQQADISVIICDEESKVESLLKQTSETPTLKSIVVTKPVSPATSLLAEEKGVKLYSFSEVEDKGAKNPHKPVPPTPSCLATVCYTSGTTGNPKGVMLTHESIVACNSAVINHLGEHTLRADDVMISFLPLAHMLERCCESAVFMSGGSVGFYSGDVRYLMEDMIALRPTITPSVPRILNRIHDKVFASVNGNAIKSWMLNMALKSKKSELDRKIIKNNGLWDRLIFKRVREGLGGRVRLMVVGSAPIAGNVLDFARAALGCVIVEGYGQTECVSCGTLTIAGDNATEHVGPPIPCCSIKLVDVPEMKYFAENNQGEICVKGPSVFQGYFKDPEKTAETLDSDKWLHTGDIGMWLPNGALKVFDRKKHIFKLSQGEYIAPEKIENIYQRSMFVSQLFVHGDSLKSCLIAIIVPDKEVLTNWCNENEVRGSWLQICENKEVKKTIINSLIAEGKKAGLKSFEQVKEIFLFNGLFTVDNGLLTPTLKTKRPECRHFFASQLEVMYSNLD